MSVLTSRPLRHLGAAIGMATGLSAACAQAYSGNADGRLHVWLLALFVGGLLGALTLPIFAKAEDERFSLGFLALFGFAVTLVGGTFVTFPVGASLGTLGGAIGAVVAGLVWRIRRLEESPWRAPATAVVACCMALVSMFAWVNG